jgi:hypothetical protein
MSISSYIGRFIFLLITLSIILFLFCRGKNYTFQKALKSAFFISLAATIAQFLWDIILK